MNKYTSTYHAQFITATILEWKHLLKEDSFKDIIINSLLRPCWCCHQQGIPVPAKHGMI